MQYSLRVLDVNVFLGQLLSFPQKKMVNLSHFFAVSTKGESLEKNGEFRLQASIAYSQGQLFAAGPGELG